MSNIKDSDLWNIWGEIWNVAKKYYPAPADDSAWQNMINDCTLVCSKYSGTIYENFVTNTVMQLTDLYEKLGDQDR